MMLWVMMEVKMLRTLSPCIESTLRQKEISFLKASMSKTVCKIDTSAVIPNRYGLDSRKMRFISSWSPSVWVPMDVCCFIEASHCTTISHLNFPSTRKMRSRGRSSMVSLTGIIFCRVIQNSFMYVIGQYLSPAALNFMCSRMGRGMPCGGNTESSSTRSMYSSGFHIPMISSSRSSVMLSSALAARISLSFSDMSPDIRFFVFFALGRFMYDTRSMTACATSCDPKL
mmetsp:Transcript_44688/g.91205  ORF Transcript_44688/g.91205 Transcript_44688/m.91205 type:complete len:228 (-) Transcript_44688:695-1378(-)